MNYQLGYLLCFILVMCGCSNGSDETNREVQRNPDKSSEVDVPHSVQSDKKAEIGDEDVYANMRGTAGSGESHPGRAIYKQHCAQCHSQPVMRAPDKSFLQMLPGDMIVHTLKEGVMQQMAKNLSDDEKNQVAEYLAGSTKKENPFPLLMCDVENSKFDYSKHPFAKGWGFDRNNTRFIPANVAQLSRQDVTKLKLKWAFAYPNTTRIRSQPALAGGAVFMGSQDGTVYSLNGETGCVRWTFRATAEVRTGITISDWSGDQQPLQAPLLYFSDLIARTYALNADTGQLAWMKKVDDHPTATATAQPVLYQGVVYQPASSLEEAAAMDPAYQCCSFRGSISALDALTGELLWKSYTIKEQPVQVGMSSAGVPSLAPSGAPIWNSPAIDEKRGLLYVGTGGNYSSPSQGTSDALLGFSLTTGEIKWTRQTTSGDAWNVACMPFIKDKANCPVENGPDVDFAAALILIQKRDQEILIGAQKSGIVYGIDQVSGDIVWQQKPGRGGNQGGINFGLAAEGDTVFVPVADYDDDILPIEDARPGLYAFNAFNGEPVWSSPAVNVCAERKDCDPGISAPVTAIPGVVFAGHMDAWLRAYDSTTGKVLWEFDTFQEIKTVSGEIAHGGTMSGGSGPVVANGRVYANSGYGIYFHMPGNVLLVFEVADEE
ncbi:MAG: PQQ-binding-like beta-propeller repeat protein [Gammaproteobacteria bacterium]|nr:PQQ-binding-like beta-propeller repeat protein [Gammaproteobacteria bacterium]